MAPTSSERLTLAIPAPPCDPPHVPFELTKRRYQFAVYIPPPRIRPRVAVKPTPIPRTGPVVALLAVAGMIALLWLSGCSGAVDNSGDCMETLERDVHFKCSSAELQEEIARPQCWQSEEDKAAYMTLRRDAILHEGCRNVHSDSD
jgi:hypothetical protein